MTFQRHITGALVLATAMAAGMNVNTAQAEHSERSDSYARLDTLASHLQDDVRDLFKEFRIHYVHTPEYRHLMSDLIDVYGKSRYFHDLIHRRSSAYQLKRAINSLDRKFHHMQRTVNRLRADADHGIGHIHGHDRSLNYYLSHIEEVLHKTKDRVNMLHYCNVRRGGHGYHGYHGVGNAYGPAGHGGFTVGKGKHGIHIGGLSIRF